MITNTIAGLHGFIQLIIHNIMNENKGPQVATVNGYSTIYYFS